MADDLMDFQSAIQELQMDETELSNLVARGDLRVIRSGGKPMFRPGDIQALKQDRETEPTIIIPASGAAPAPSESGPITIDLPDNLGADIDESAATVVPDSAPDTGTEEIVFDDTDLEVLPLDEEASQTSALTAAGVDAIDESEVTVIDDDDAGATQVQDEAEYAEVEEVSDVTASGRRRGVSARRSSVSVSRRMSAAYDVKPGHPVMTGLMVASALALLFAGSILGVILSKGYSVQYPDPETGPHTAKYVPGYLVNLEKDAELWFEPPDSTLTADEDDDFGGDDDMGDDALDDAADDAADDDDAGDDGE